MSRYGAGSIASMSFDKGFTRAEDRELLSLYVPTVVMPQRGKKNAEEAARESDKRFVALRRQHSAVESEIASLEHHWLNRCLDVVLEGYGGRWGACRLLPLPNTSPRCLHAALNAWHRSRKREFPARDYLLQTGRRFPKIFLTTVTFTAFPRAAKAAVPIGKCFRSSMDWSRAHSRAVM